VSESMNGRGVLCYVVVDESVKSYVGQEHGGVSSAEFSTIKCCDRKDEVVRTVTFSTASGVNVKLIGSRAQFQDLAKQIVLGSYYQSGTAELIPPTTRKPSFATPTVEFDMRGGSLIWFDFFATGIATDGRLHFRLYTNGTDELVAALHVDGSWEAFLKLAAAFAEAGRERLLLSEAEN